MPVGTSINRNFVVMLRSGVPAIDWGDGLFQDILSGDFLHLQERDVDHTILDIEIDQLVLCERVYSYNATTMYLYPLPDLPHRPIE